jgi:hypothetical protein
MDIQELLERLGSCQSGFTRALVECAEQNPRADMNGLTAALLELTEILGAVADEGLVVTMDDGQVGTININHFTSLQSEREKNELIRKLQRARTNMR